MRLAQSDRDCIGATAKSITREDIIGVNSLHLLFQHCRKIFHLAYSSRCHHCGRAVKIEIYRTSGGYGLLGGVVYEPDPKNSFTLCLDCHNSPYAGSEDGIKTDVAHFAIPASRRITK